MTTAPPAGARDRRLLFAAVAAPWIWLTLRFRFVTDDAFITFRYARNFAEGHGLRYNLGDQAPVEGYSNFLWVIVCSALEKLGVDVVVGAPLLSAACGLALLVLVFDRLLRRFGCGSTAAALATLSLSCFPPFALWSTGGLETMPFALLVFLLFDRLVLREEPSGLGAGIVALLLALLRVEGIFWVVVILGIAAISRRAEGRSLRPLLTAAGIAGIGFAAWWTGRFAYYGDPLPNPVYVKAPLDAARLARGFRYVATHFLTFLSPFLIVPGTIVAARRAELRPVALMAWAFPAWAILVTGDFMAMGRFLVPGAAFQTILVAVLIERAARGPRRRALVAAATLAIVVVAALPAWNRHAVPTSVRERFRFRPPPSPFESEYEWWRYHHVLNVDRGTVTGKALASYVKQRRAEPDPSYVTSGIGVVGWYSNLFTFDVAGLVTPEVARRKIDPDEPLRMPGHDKVVPRDWFLKDEPTLLDAVVLVDAPPCEVARLARMTAAGLRKRTTVQPALGSWIADFAKVGADAAAGSITHLVAVARITPGTSREEAETDLESRLRVLCPEDASPPSGDQDLLEDAVGK